MLTLDGGEDLLAKVVIIPSRGSGIDVLVAAHAGEAVDHRDDHRPHLARSDETIQFHLQVFAKRIDAKERLPGSRVADDPVRRGIPFPWIVLRREIDSHVSTRRILERISFQHLRIEPLDDDLPTGHPYPAGTVATEH